MQKLMASTALRYSKRKFCWWCSMYIWYLIGMRMKIRGFFFKDNLMYVIIRITCFNCMHSYLRIFNFCCLIRKWFHDWNRTFKTRIWTNLSREWKIFRIQQQAIEFLGHRRHLWLGGFLQMAFVGHALSVVRRPSCVTNFPF